MTETITITMTGATTFTVSGTNCGGGAITSGGLTATAGSTVTWGRANYCSFTLTQGSIPFANNDVFILASTSAASYSCAPGAASNLQPANKVSYCAEAAGYYPGFTSGAWGSGDSYTSGWANGTYTYDEAKGRMGRTSTYPVYWRLPTKYDYQQADNDGIRFVMPDMGAANSSRPVPDGSPGGSNSEWSASTTSISPRSSSWNFFSNYGNFGSFSHEFDDE